MCAGPDYSVCVAVSGQLLLYLPIVCGAGAAAPRVLMISCSHIPVSANQDSPCMHQQANVRSLAQTAHSSPAPSTRTPHTLWGPTDACRNLTLCLRLSPTHSLLPPPRRPSPHFPLPLPRSVSFSHCLAFSPFISRESWRGPDSVLGFLDL